VCAIHPKHKDFEVHMNKSDMPTESQSEEWPRVIRTAFEPGHFYSPVVDPKDLLPHQSRLWPANPNVLGIDFNDVQHEHLLRDVFPKYLSDYDYPERLEDADDLDRFYTQNSQFSWLDSRTLFVMLRHLRPRRLIEVGSGYSTLLMRDVNQRFLNQELHIACIEPFPRPFLRNAQGGIELVESKVQDIPLSFFEQLRAGDVLFIDSSHVAKTGSDVNFLYFEVLPRLPSGVFVHIHDIFLPHDYKKEWVLHDNRSWNEQYVLRALLMFSARFKIEFGCSYANYRYPELVQSVLSLPGGKTFGGGSLWISVNQ
jgi:Methyltransferase domain